MSSRQHFRSKETSTVNATMNGTGHSSDVFYDCYQLNGMAQFSQMFQNILQFPIFTSGFVKLTFQAVHTPTLSSGYFQNRYVSLTANGNRAITEKTNEVVSLGSSSHEFEEKHEPEIEIFSSDKDMPSDRSSAASFSVKEIPQGEIKPKVEKTKYQPEKCSNVKPVEKKNDPKVPS
jgi:hypothetical protein